MAALLILSPTSLPRSSSVSPGNSELLVHRPHHLLWIAQSGGGALRYHFAYAAKIIVRQLYSQCTHVLLEVFAALCTGDRHYVFTLRQHPRQCQLRRLAFLFRGDFFHATHEVKILLEILPLKTRR